MMAIISTIFIMALRDLSHKITFCSFRRVIWLLTQCFKLLSFYIYLLFSNFAFITGIDYYPFSASILCSLRLLPNTIFKL